MMPAKAIIVYQPGAADAVTQFFQDKLDVSLVAYSLPGVTGSGSDETRPAFRTGGLLLPRLSTVVANVTPRQFQLLKEHKGRGIIEAVYPDWVTTTPRLRSAKSWAKVPTPSPGALKAMSVSTNGPTGTGVKVAVLDSGFDPNRKGFGGPDVQLWSAVEDNSTADRYGHGTHCAGLVGGNVDDSGNRFGVAPDVNLYCCKVMYGQIGLGSALVLGIEGALARRVDVILIAQEFSAKAARRLDFDYWGQRAIDQCTLIIAAAGNKGPRGTVRLPGAAVKVAAVGALTNSAGPLENSSRSGSTAGSEVDFAAPGEEIYSACAQGRYLNLSGTSMAAAHAAGIAALWVEKEKVYGADLWVKMASRAAVLRTAKPAEAGAGIVQAP